MGQEREVEKLDDKDKELIHDALRYYLYRPGRRGVAALDAGEVARAERIGRLLSRDGES